MIEMASLVGEKATMAPKPMAMAMRAITPTILPVPWRSLRRLSRGSVRRRRPRPRRARQRSAPAGQGVWRTLRASLQLPATSLA